MSEPEDRSHQEVDEEAEEKSAPSAHVVYEAIRKEGRHEIDRKASSLAWSGLAAGLSMGFSFVTQAMLEHHLPETNWRPLVATLGYSVGFLIVVLGRQQLFTENTLTAILPLLHKQTAGDLIKVARLWTIVLLANLIGAFVFALVIAKTAAFEPDVHQAFDALASQAGTHPFGVTVLRGIFAGWLIALMVWLMPGAETARIWIIVIITFIVGLCHFPHIIAGATELFYLGINGIRSWPHVLGGFILPALIGNTIGGVTLVAALAHAQIVGDKQQTGERER
ncbi:MAG: formate/nitrite transporter family protein [Chthoniobacterales bacterium]